MTCPSCGYDHIKPHLPYHPEKQAYYCPKCGLKFTAEEYKKLYKPVT